MKTKSAKLEPKTDEILERLKSFDFIHSILLFGSRARGKTGRDIDLCIIPPKELSLRERLSIDSAMQYYSKTVRQRMKIQIAKSNSLHT